MCTVYRLIDTDINTTLLYIVPCTLTAVAARAALRGICVKRSIYLSIIVFNYLHI